MSCFVQAKDASDRSELVEKLKNLSTTKTDLQVECENLKRELQDAVSVVEEQNIQLKQKESIYQDLLISKTHLDREFKDLEAEKENLSIQVQQKCDDLDSMMARLGKAEEENGVLRESLQGKEHDIQSLYVSRHDFDSVQAEKEKLGRDLEELRDVKLKLVELESQYQDAINTVAEQRQSVEKLDEELEIARQDFAQAQERILELEDERLRVRENELKKSEVCASHIYRLICVLLSGALFLGD